MDNIKALTFTHPNGDTTTYERDEVNPSHWFNVSAGNNQPITGAELTTLVSNAIAGQASSQVSGKSST